MLITTVLLFAIAAILGALLITKVFRKKKSPKPVVYTHGLAAAVALVLLKISKKKTIFGENEK